MEKIDDLILTAGPTITNLEMKYAIDAAENGWNNHHSDYIREFEKQFAKYIGVKYALATSSCTGALHLALAGLNVKKGDEVIVPEISWIATASAVKYTGAKPVFCDIDPKTWVMDVQKIEKLITKNTKAIIPVHLYGNVVDMDPLMKIATKYNLKVIEDAAPSIGTIYKSRKTGSFGNAAAFSFQGAKALVTGEGGMFVTNDEELYTKVKMLWDHGRNPEKPLEANQIGFKYKMSNIQAALGLAQIQRVEEIVAKKREIYNWYKIRLENVKELTLNYEYPGTRNIYWMTTMILSKSAKINRDAFMTELKLRNIDSRIVFSPMSSFPMFKSRKNQNVISYDVPYRGVNLPSGHNLKEDEIDYICACIKDILGYKTDFNFSNRIGYRIKIKKMFSEIKTSVENSLNVNLDVSDLDDIKMEPLTLEHNNEEIIKKLYKWRKKNQQWFPTQFNVSYEGTKNWFKKQYIEKKDRIMFLISDESKFIGHIGLNTFDFDNKTCELDNVIRGEVSSSKGTMFKASSKLLNWAFKHLEIERVYLRVFSDNSRAINLYERLGFKEISRSPLTKMTINQTISWEERIIQKHDVIDRYFVTMSINRGDYYGHKN